MRKPDWSQSKYNEIVFCFIFHIFSRPTTMLHLAVAAGHLAVTKLGNPHSCFTFWVRSVEFSVQFNQYFGNCVIDTYKRKFAVTVILY